MELFHAALDSGITIFDTTYQGERLALGAAMEASGRRDEATVIVWNFLCVAVRLNAAAPSATLKSHHLASYARVTWRGTADWRSSICDAYV